MKSLKYMLGLAGLNLLILHGTFAQFNLDGQILIRSEYRNGYNRPIAEGEEPAGFIAHRARLQAGYRLDLFSFYMSVQDVRTWGSTSQANIADGFLSVHEAWGEFSLNEYWHIKLGRQELNYDNARFLGNLDWALQARSHDFALVRYEKEKARLHFGAGFNQDGQKVSGNIFTTPNQYRTAQLVRYENTVGKVDFSLLFWNEGRQKVVRDSLGTVISDDVYFRQTIGVPTLKTTLNRTTLSGYFYYQTGKDTDGVEVSAFNTSAQISQLLYSSETGRQWRAILGFEMISGTDGGSQGKNHSYSLQYGTNHLFNGYMDWFFIGNAWENSVGLNDIYLRSRYTFNPGLWIQADLHHFSAFAKFLDPEGEPAAGKNIGSEMDLTFGLVINDAVSLQGGYSQMFLSGNYRDIRSAAFKDTQNWAYLMFIFRPTSKAKFIGVLQ